MGVGQRGVGETIGNKIWVTNLMTNNSGERKIGVSGLVGVARNCFSKGGFSRNAVSLDSIVLFLPGGVRRFGPWLHEEVTGNMNLNGDALPTWRCQEPSRSSTMYPWM